MRLRLGDRELLVKAGQAASFDTMTPHSLSAYGGPSEILSILDHHGARAPDPVRREVLAVCGGLLLPSCVTGPQQVAAVGEHSASVE